MTTHLVDAIADALDELRAAHFTKGVVSGTTSSGAVLVAVDGSTLTVGRLDRYTPVTGDVVLLMAVDRGSWVIADKIV